ncbi:hypothetical protein C1Y40_01253 [Mycobacterium talmoniae]|uniref:Uncharacterized protein n=1 Tax=Mycobacterium talmoniae TaxID=1858794 RepID=A0A2S8BPI0_9MYCO|nr:hypothetical protein C1Y40_01253 [Mycobacterium talmoniae]
MTAATARPPATINGAAATRFAITRRLFNEALTNSLTVQPIDSAAPRNPAASGSRCASRCPSSGTYRLALVAAINRPSVR